VVLQEALLVPGVGWGSAILPNGVYASLVGRAHVGRQGRCLLGVSVCCGSVVAEGLCGPVDRLGLHGLGHTDSRYSKVTFGEGFG